LSFSAWIDYRTIKQGFYITKSFDIIVQYIPNTNPP